MTTLSKGQTDKLKEIVDATNSPAGMLYKTEKGVQLLVDAGYVECNIALTNPDNAKEVAVRATPTGAAYLTSVADNGEALAVAPPTTEGNTMTNPAFNIEDNVEIPAIKRAGRTTALYPFDELEEGQSFFVPATEAMPDPGKSLASTVSSASKRYAKQDGVRSVNRRNKETGELEPHEVPNYNYERKFMVRSVEEEGVKGARVWRIEV